MLPTRPREAMIDVVERIERRTGLTSLMLAVLLVYWLARLLYGPAQFAHLMGG